jgi:hypothetical protein
MKTAYTHTYEQNISVTRTSMQNRLLLKHIRSLRHLINEHSQHRVLNKSIHRRHLQNELCFNFYSYFLYYDVTLFA